MLTGSHTGETGSTNVSIIVLSVKDTERDKVTALDLGADDYACKPFGMNEVMARIRVSLRYAAQVESGVEPIFTVGPLRVDFAHRQVQVDGQEVKLTPTEYDLLKTLIMKRYEVIRHLIDADFPRQHQYTES